MQKPTGNWMPLPPQGVAGCPPGLGYLALIDNVFIKQKVNLLEAIVDFEAANNYEVLNQKGERIYYAAEKTDCMTRQCCGKERPFDMSIVDNFGVEVIALDRPLKCDCCLCFCCLQSLSVMAPRGNVVGNVVQQCDILNRPRFFIQNAVGQNVLRIEGPCCACPCGEIEFHVLSAAQGVQVGKISKKWGGIVRELLTDADTFGISFPLDLDVKMKAAMLGACFLIDFLYFEKDPNDASLAMA